MVAYDIFNLYSIGISMQVFGPIWEKVLRYFYTFLASIVITLLSVFSRNSFYSILSNLGSITGCWTAMFFVIVLQEDLISRRRIGYDLSVWNDSTKLPVGLAVGYIMAMGQTWYHRPIAKAITPDGSGIGTRLGFAFCGISCPLLRYFGLKEFGR